MSSRPTNNPNSAIDNYAALLNLVRQDMTVPANYAAAAAQLDVDDFITYMIVNYYVGNDDWAHQNWYASYNRVDPAGKWRYHSWDAERAQERQPRQHDLNNVGGPTEVLQRLIVNPEFAAFYGRRPETDANEAC
jgi:spore coat protein CotH